MDNVRNHYLRSYAYEGNSYMVESYLKDGANINSQCPEEGNTALHLAADRGHSIVVMFLLKNGANMEIKNSKGKSAWDLASQKTHNVVLTLLELQIFVKCSWNSFFSVMSGVDLAIPAGKIQSLYCALKLIPHFTEVILRRLQPDVNAAESKHNHTPLHIAGSRECLTEDVSSPHVELLLKRKANCHLKDKYGNTPLHLAAQNGNWEAVVWLLNAGADLTIRNLDGRSPMDLVQAKLYVYKSSPNLNKKFETIDKLIKLYQNPLPEGQEVELDVLRWKELRDHVKVIKAYESDVAGLKYPFIASGGQTPPFSCEIKHLINLTTLVFHKCRLRTINDLPEQLQSIVFEKCDFIRVQKFTLLKTVGEPFSLVHLAKVKEIAFIQCTGDLSLTFLPGMDSRIESLKIIEQNTLKDENVQSFPLSLKHLEIKGGELSSTSYKKLPATLEYLKLEQCIGVNRNFIDEHFGSCNVDPESIVLTWSEKLIKDLEKKVRGQPKVVDGIITSLSEIISNPNTPTQPKPRRIFFFIGPTGVGKTELAKAIADITKRPILRFAMETFSNQGDKTRLIGAPPSYVGHGTGNPMTKQVKEKPNAIILLDEMEKSADEVKQAFLGIFDTGEIQDAEGELINFRDTIIIMTSNLSADKIGNLDWSNSDTAYVEANNISEQAIRNAFSPEFYGRINIVFPFRPLTSQFEVTRELLNEHINTFVSKFKEEKKIDIEVEASVRNQCGSLSFSSGVREINNLIENLRGNIFRYLLDYESDILNLQKRNIIPKIRISHNGQKNIVKLMNPIF